MELELGLFAAAIVLFLLGMGLSFVSYFRETGKHYDLRNTFPFELNPFPVTKENAFGKFSLLTSFLALTVFLLIYTTIRPVMAGNSYSTLVVVIGVLGLFALFGSVLSMFLPMKDVKLHLTIDYFLFAFSFMESVGIACYGYFYFADIGSALPLISAISASVLALFEVLLMFNPKLMEWAKLERKSEEGGQIQYVRPKFFVLAFTEWMFTISLLVSAGLAFLLIAA